MRTRRWWRTCGCASCLQVIWCHLTSGVEVFVRGTVLRIRHAACGCKATWLAFVVPERECCTCPWQNVMWFYHNQASADTRSALLYSYSWDLCCCLIERMVIKVFVWELGFWNHWGSNSVKDYACPFTSCRCLRRKSVCGYCRTRIIRRRWCTQ